MEICKGYCFNEDFCARLLSKDVVSGEDKKEIEVLREVIHEIETDNLQAINNCRDNHEERCPMDYMNLDLILGRGTDLFTEFVDEDEEKDPTLLTELPF